MGNVDFASRVKIHNANYFIKIAAASQNNNLKATNIPLKHPDQSRAQLPHVNLHQHQEPKERQQI